MKHIRLLLFIAYYGIPFIGHAQADTIYYGADGHRTEFDYADFYRVIQDSGKRYKVEDFTLGNKPKMIGYFISIDTNDVNNYKNGGTIKDGYFILYTDKGYKQSEGIYQRNIKTGEWKEYYVDTNRLWHTEHYTNGKDDGELLSYYISGKLKRRESHKINDTTVTGKCFDEDGKEIPFTIFSTMPQARFDVQGYLTANLKYPNIAKNKNIEGRVTIKFVVDTDGTILNVKTVKGIGGGCDEEAVRVIASMPKWVPGTSEGRNIKVFFTMPIVFKLQ